MNSKEALETLGNVEVAVTTIRSGRTHFKTLKQQYETEFEVLERELLIKKELKDFDVYQRQLKQLEKELKQTKLNFRNSQIHSKNCYKKLKEKYIRLERAYKNNEVMTRDLNELINRNLELKDELKRSQETINAWMENHKKLIIDNGKMKKAIKILKEKLELKLEVYHNGGCTLNHKVIHNCITPDERCLRNLEIKEYELLKEVFGNE